MVFKELRDGDLFRLEISPDTFKKIPSQRRTPKGCGCDKVNAENITTGAKIKVSDFSTVEKVEQNNG